MIGLLADNPFVLLFLVLGIGYLVGKIKIGGFGLGASAVLFVGLAFGGLSPRLVVPEFVQQLGLILFVYTVGVSAGPGFVAAIRRRGLGDNLLLVVVLGLMAAVAALGGRWGGVSPAATAGAFTGATNNTPALAAVLQNLTQQGQVVSDPVLGYSVAYPFGVLGALLAIWVARRLWRRTAVPDSDADSLVNLTLRVTSPDAAGKTIDRLMREQKWGVVLSRLRHRGQSETAIPLAASVLQMEDTLVVVGPKGEVDRVVSGLGEVAEDQLSFDRSELDFRRIFVSASQAIGQPLADLRLPERFGAIVTRVRRGDKDRLARPDTVLEPGDRVRVVAPPHRLDEVGQFFGDSYRALSEIDVASFSLGLVAGLLVGLVTVPLPAGGSFRLGLAGGPLIVGLILGALERTGPITWHLPYNASLTLRQLGAVLFLAVVGIRSGHDFFDTVGTRVGLALLAIGVVVTSLGVLLMLWAGRVVLRAPTDVLCGMVAGLQTQPAVLSFAVEQAGNEAPNTGYATVYPVATITKILLAQLLLLAG